MNKIKLALIIAFFGFILNNSFAQNMQLSTKWQTAKYENIEDFSNMDFLYDSEGGLLFLLTNDENNLYVHLRTIAEIPEKKLIELGFSIEINVKGDKTKRLVEYPLPKNERMEPVILIQNNSEERRKDFNLIKEQVIKQINTIRLTGFGKEEKTLVKSTENEFNITGDIKFNKKGQLQYLLTIPLKSLGVSLKDDVSMNFTLKSGSMEVENQGPPQNVDVVGGQGQGGGGQGGRGGQGGFGQGGGSQGVGQGPQQGNMDGDEDSGERQQHMEERTEMSKAIIVRLKKMVLAKKP